MNLSYVLPLSLRLVDAEEYAIESYDTFYGFVMGMLAGNYDIQEIFVDGILKIGGRDYDELGAMFEKLNAHAKDVKIIFTVSTDAQELPEKVKAFM